MTSDLVMLGVGGAGGGTSSQDEDKGTCSEGSVNYEDPDFSGLVSDVICFNLWHFCSFRNGEL